MGRHTSPGEDCGKERRVLLNPHIQSTTLGLSLGRTPGHSVRYGTRRWLTRGGRGWVLRKVFTRTWTVIDVEGKEVKVPRPSVIPFLLSFEMSISGFYEIGS